MRLFWERGYEGATLEDLLQAMGGITAPSLYHAFGSKEELFKQTCDLYIATVGEKSSRALETGHSARQGIEAMLRATVEMLSSPGYPRGCMLVSSAAKCARGNEGVEAYVRALRQKAPDIIKGRVKRAIQEGELPASTDAGRIAAFYSAVGHGLGVRASDGASRAELTAVVDGAMAAWDGLTRPTRSSRQRPP
jgi:AcrR family transcriptional regulator